MERTQTFHTQFKVNVGENMGARESGRRVWAGKISVCVPALFLVLCLFVLKEKANQKEKSAQWREEEKKETL